ncbi:MAG: VWA domain-containing protein [Vicinamibacterales bacterium]
MPLRGAVQHAGLLPFVAFVATLATSSHPHAQFRTGTTLVVVDVAVTGPDGEIVRDLTAADFELLVDGARTPIEQLRLVDASLAPPEADTPDGVASNAAEPGGVFALVIDELNLGPRSGIQARRLAMEFIQNTLQPHDYAAVLRSGSTAALLFSTDRNRLIGIARGTSGRGGIAQDGAAGVDVIGAAEAGANGPISSDGIDPADFGDGGTLFDPAAGLEMVRLVVERLAAVPSRRKAVLWFNEGLSVDVRAALANPTDLTGEKLREVVRAAFEGNVAVYPVDPRGLYSGPNVSRFRKVPEYGTELDALRDVARVTGGSAIVNTNSVAKALVQVARENRAYYLLGYAPTAPPERTWRVQSIDVRVRRPVVTVRHRTGFVPLARPAVPALVPVAAPLPIRGVRVAMAPALVSHLSRSPSVVAPFAVLGGLPVGSDATYLVMAVDEKGVMRAQQSGRVPRSGARAVTAAPRLSLPAGNYQFRLIVQGVGTGGTVFADVTVPKDAASSAVCAGVHLEQAGAELASATHVFAGGAALRAHATASALGHLKGSDVSAVVESEGVTVLSAPVSVSPAGRGWWRLESSLTLPTAAGRYRLRMHSDGRPIDSCSTELDVAP